MLLSDSILVAVNDDVCYGIKCEKHEKCLNGKCGKFLIIYYYIVLLPDSI